MVRTAALVTLFQVGYVELESSQIVAKTVVVAWIAYDSVVMATSPSIDDVALVTSSWVGRVLLGTSFSVDRWPSVVFPTAGNAALTLPYLVGSMDQAVSPLVGPTMKVASCPIRCLYLVTSPLA